MFDHACQFEIEACAFAAVRFGQQARLVAAFELFEQVPDGVTFGNRCQSGFSAEIGLRRGFNQQIDDKNTALLRPVMNMGNRVGFAADCKRKLG